MPGWRLVQLKGDLGGPIDSQAGRGKGPAQANLGVLVLLGRALVDAAWDRDWADLSGLAG